MFKVVADAARRCSGKTRLAAPVAALSVALMALAGCGGGQDPNAGRAELGSRVRALADIPAATGSSAKPIDTATLFNWAEAQFTSLFPSGPVNQALDAGGASYTIRFYSSTGNYLGVSDGRVYGFGPFTNFQLVSFGFTADFTCQAAPQNCLPPTGIAMAWDAAGPVWDGSDWQ